jgi:hypothetical protein
MSLSGYLKRELSLMAGVGLPTMDELLERVAKRPCVNIGAEHIVEIIRAHRDA